jgi:hypothetical protein
MSLSVTEQKFKGGETKAVVRDGKVVLMTFALEMKSLALKMAQEGNEGKLSYPELVNRFSKLRERWKKNGVEVGYPPQPFNTVPAEAQSSHEVVEPPPAPLPVGGGVQGHCAPAIISSPSPEVTNGPEGAKVVPANSLNEIGREVSRIGVSLGVAFTQAVESAAAAEKARVDELAKSRVPDHAQESVPSEPKQPEGVDVDDWLGALLSLAKDAEIALAWRRGEFSKAKAELAEAEGAAHKAWKAFNQALRASLPEDSAIQGVQAQ